MPADIAFDGTSYLNNYGGGILLGDAGNNGYQNFTLWFDRLSAEACVKITNSIVNGGSSEVNGININGTENFNVGTNNSEKLSINSISDKCSEQNTALLGINMQLR